jgi:hypothetical protein
MANFIVSYDLNGPRPTHAEMDKHLATLHASKGRILETVWYVGYSGTFNALYDHVKSILGPEDRLLVVEASEAVFSNLLVNDESLIAAWRQNRG